MKRPTAASLKKVTVENLVGLGADRLAQILVATAATRPELKRRLRMELAAEQGSEHLAVEIDKRLGALKSSRSRVSWRQRPTFIRDLDLLRVLIAQRLAALDRAGALERLWLFMNLSRQTATRMRDRDGELTAVFDRAAEDLGDLLQDAPARVAADVLADAVAGDPQAWAAWLPTILKKPPPELADAALRRLSVRSGATPAWAAIVRLLADAAGDADAYLSTFAPAALKAPAVAAEAARRLLAADRIKAAGALLMAARSPPGATEPDFAWESAWIDYLDCDGDAGAAQETRWASFERTLSVERARAFTRRLPDFEDVEAEHRAFAHAAAHADFARGLEFLMTWPALPEAAQMIRARPDDVEISPDQAEAWASALQGRHPDAAHVLLRKAAAAAFRRRDFKTCDRLTEEADAIAV